ncbi:MAG: hypothetical protein AABY63_07740, partial [candidate division NC10 bacterium]
TKAMENLPNLAGEAHRRLLDQWLTLARVNKNTVVTALNEGFALWERECRRLIGAPHAAIQPSLNPLEVWAENWRKTVDAFAASSQLGQTWSEAVRKQVQLVQQTMQEGLSAWQQLWQTLGPKPGRKVE